MVYHEWINIKNMLKKSNLRIEDFQRGVVRCVSCVSELPFSGKAGLESHRCPQCGAMVFFPLKVKKFWLYEPLGIGGVGRVYKACAEGTHEEYAVKVLQRSRKTDTELIKTLIREEKIAQALGKSPHLVEVVDCGQDGDEYFVATKFLEGQRLDILIAKKRRLTEEETLSIALQIIDAEIYICERGYLFRDLKPENIIIEKNGNVRLFDYGLCISHEDAVSSEIISDDFEGSPFYIPPERIVGASEGEYSEIYSLGMLMYHMLAGHTYYSESEIKNIIAKHISSLRICTVRNQLKFCNSKTISIIDKMISRNPNARYHNFRALKRDMEDAYSLISGASAACNETEMLAKAKSRCGGDSKNVEREKTGKPLLSTTGIIVMVIIAIIMAAVFLTAWFVLKEAKNEHIRQEIRAETALKLGISPDIRAVDLSLDGAAKLVTSRANEIFAEKSAALPVFNEKEEEAKVCLELKVDAAFKKLPTQSVSGVETIIKQKIDELIEREKRKTVSEFPGDLKKRQIAAELGIKLPVSDPVFSRKDVDREFESYIKRLESKEFSAKKLSDEIMLAQKEYAEYKIGETVKLSDAAGLSVEGRYNGKSGNKVIIGDRAILITDIPASERWKFDEDACQSKTAKAVAAITKNYKEKRTEYRTLLEQKNKDNYYKKYGYYKAEDGSWKTANELLQERLDKAEEEFRASVAALEKTIELRIKKDFDRDSIFLAYGYRQVDGAWYSEAEAIDILLDRRRREFQSERDKTLEKVRRDAQKQAESEIYPAHGYIFYKGGWQAAKPLLDEMLEDKLQGMK